MIEAIREIGEYVNKCASSTHLENYSKKIPLELKKKKQYVLIFNFDTENNRITCEYEEVKPDSGKKFLWLGNNPGNKPQIYFTSDVFSNIFGDSISNIKERVDAPLKNELEKILEDFFTFVTLEETKDKKKIWMVNFNKFSLLNSDTKIKFLEDNSDLLKELSNKTQKKDQAKENSKKYLKTLNKIILNSLKPKLESNEVSLYTVTWNGSPLVTRQEYRKMLLNEKIGCLFQSKR